MTATMIITTSERACSFVTYQFVFHIVNHHSLRSMNNTVDYSDLFGKCHDCIEMLHRDPMKLEKKKHSLNQEISKDP